MAALICAAVAPGLSIEQPIVRAGMPPTTPACVQSMARLGSRMPLQSAPPLLPPALPDVPVEPDVPDAPAAAAPPLAAPPLAPPPLAPPFDELLPQSNENNKSNSTQIVERLLMVLPRLREFYTHRRSGSVTPSVAHIGANH